jgi:threonine/homoserine/homoserine lactone efflux protein
MHDALASRSVDIDLVAFVVASIVIIVVPGVDFALVTRQVVGYGRRAAFVTLAGLVVGGLTHATLATLGLSALLIASTRLFLALKIAGAAYLLYIGLQTLWATRTRRRGVTESDEPATGAGHAAAVPAAAAVERAVAAADGTAGAPRAVVTTAEPATAAGTPDADAGEVRGSGRTMTTRRAFLLGISSNLLNPKVIVFYVTFLPQFVHAGQGAAQRTAMLAAIFISLAVAWWICYILLVTKLQAWLLRPRVRRVIERLTGIALVGFGLRIAFER